MCLVVGSHDILAASLQKHVFDQMVKDEEGMGRVLFGQRRHGCGGYSTRKVRYVRDEKRLKYITVLG